MKQKKAQLNYLELQRLVQTQEEFRFFCFHRCVVQSVASGAKSELGYPFNLNASPVVTFEIAIYDLETLTSFIVTLRDPVFAGQSNESAKFLGVTAQCG